MKSKAPLILMEQTVMVLVFALAAAICVRGFVLSDSVSKTNAAQDAAMLRAESAAEIYKNCRGDGSAAVKRYGGAIKGTIWTVYWDEGWKQVKTARQAAYRLQIQPESKNTAKMGNATVKVFSLKKNEKMLLSFPLAWQEADDNE